MHGSFGSANDCNVRQCIIAHSVVHLNSFLSIIKFLSLLPARVASNIQVQARRNDQLLSLVAPFSKFKKN